MLQYVAVVNFELQRDAVCTIELRVVPVADDVTLTTSELGPCSSSDRIPRIFRRLFLNLPKIPRESYDTWQDAWLRVD